MEYQLPKTHEVPLCWGPPTVDDEVNHLPCEIFNKADRITQVANFLDERPQYSTSGPFQLSSTGGSGFQEILGAARISALERAKKAESKSRGRGRGRGRGADGRGGGFRGGFRGGAGGRGGRGGRGRGYVRREQVFRTATVAVTEDSTIIETFELPKLSKQTATVPRCTDLRVCARPRLVDNQIDTANVSNPVQLKQFPDISFTRCTTRDDPIIRDLAKNYPGTQTVIFATDEIMAAMMTSTRSVNSWDLTFYKFDRFVFIDKRAESNIDVQWVHENAPWDAPNDNNAEDINSCAQLGAEATAASRFFRQQTLSKKVFQDIVTDKAPEGFSGADKTPTMYKYRKWSINEGLATQYDVVVRCEIDGVQNIHGEPKFVRAFSLLERVAENKAWEKLGSARGNVLVNEIKMNSYQVAKWTAMSILSGAEAMKIAFVTRANETDRTKHNIVGVDTKKPIDFASQIGLNVQSMWYMFSLYVDEFIASGVDRAGIVKMPDKAVVTMFEEPEESDSSDDDSSDDDSSDDDSSEEESD